MKPRYLKALAALLARSDLLAASGRIMLTHTPCRETPSADRDALICSIVSRWPDTTAEEIELALELASALEVELIDR